MAPQRITLPDAAQPRDDTGLRVLARDARTMLPRDEKAWTDPNTALLTRALAQSSEDFSRAVGSFLSVGREEKRRLEEAKLQTAIDSSVNATPDQIAANLSGIPEANRAFADLVIRGRQGKEAGAAWSSRVTSQIQNDPTLYNSSPEAIDKTLKETRDQAIGPRGQEAAFVANFDAHFNPTRDAVLASLTKAQADQTYALNVDAAKSEFAELAKGATVVGADLPAIAAKLSASLRVDEGTGMRPEAIRQVAAEVLRDLILAGNLVEARVLGKLVSLPSGHIIGNDLSFDAQMKQAEHQMLSEQAQLESRARANEDHARAEEDRAATREFAKLAIGGIRSGPQFDRASARLLQVDPGFALSAISTLKNQARADDTQATREAAAAARVSMQVPGADRDAIRQRAFVGEFGTDGPDVLREADSLDAHDDQMAIVYRHNPEVNETKRKIDVLLTSNAQALLSEIGQITGSVGTLSQKQAQALNMLILNEQTRFERQLVQGPMNEVIKRSDELYDALKKRVDGKTKVFRDTVPGAQYSTPNTLVDPLSPELVKNSAPVFEALKNVVNSFTDGRAGRTKDFRAKVLQWAEQYIAARRSGVSEFGQNELVSIFEVHKNKFPPGTTFEEFLEGIVSFAKSSSGAPAGK